MIRGKIPSNIPNNSTLALATTPAGNWSGVVGQTTGSSIILPSNTVTMSTMTVKAGTLTISVSPSPAPQTIVAGAGGVVFANYLFDATQSGEDIRFSAMLLQLTPGGQLSNGANSSLATCQLFDGAKALNTGSSVVTPLASGTYTWMFSFDESLLIQK